MWCGQSPWLVPMPPPVSQTQPQPQPQHHVAPPPIIAGKVSRSTPLPMEAIRPVCDLAGTFSLSETYVIFFRVLKLWFTVCSLHELSLHIWLDLDWMNWCVIYFLTKCPLHVYHEKKQNQKQNFSSLFFEFSTLQTLIDWLLIYCPYTWTFFSLRLWVFLPYKSVYCARLIYT